MKTKIVVYGGSLGVRIPKVEAEVLKLKPGDIIEWEIKEVVLKKSDRIVEPTISVPNVVENGDDGMQAVEEEFVGKIVDSVESKKPVKTGKISLK